MATTRTTAEHRASDDKRKPYRWGGKTRHERGYGSNWDRLRKVILKRDNYLCQRCLSRDRTTELMVKPYDHAVDHIIPKAKGGTDGHSNLQSLCAPCHEIKTEEDKAPRTDRLQRPDGWNP
jgi:5-methylcytosine-specific restriction endonuclease McrA